jgi:hypothetical protein
MYLGITSSASSDVNPGELSSLKDRRMRADIERLGFFSEKG